LSPQSLPSGGLNNHHLQNASRTHISILIHENSCSCSSTWIIHRESLFDTHRAQSPAPFVSPSASIDPSSPYTCPSHILPRKASTMTTSILLRPSRAFELTSRHNNRYRTFPRPNNPNMGTRYNPLADVYPRCSLRSRVSGKVYAGEDWFEEEFQD
jgi:hypothetical protein